MAEVTLPYKPRQQLEAYHDRKERFACLVAHRRFGKTVGVINDLIRDCLSIDRKDVRVAYIAPYYSQAKAVAWDYVKEFTAPIPGRKVNESELRIDFANGARIRLFGADNYDAMRGLYFDAVGIDEPADFPANAWPAVIRPALSDRKGKATFIGTPKGKNEFWEISENARKSKTWFYANFPVSQTSLVDDEELSEALDAMGQDRYDQEFECSFEAAIVGSYYGTEMKAATKDGRVRKVPYDPAMPVVTAWDLGMSDSTAIWFAQFVGGERRLIDYYETGGEALDHYVKVLRDRDYIYSRHVLPHDVEVRELGTGVSRLETLKKLGIRDVTIAPKMPVDDGIQAVRLWLRNAYFDEGKCERGIESMRQYRRDWDEKAKNFKGRPMHDWTSHGADAMRYLVTGYKEAASKRTGRIKRNFKGAA